MSSERKTSSWSSMLGEHRTQKVSAALLTLVMILFVRGQIESDLTRTFSIEGVDAPENFVALGTFPDLTVTVAGSPRRLRSWARETPGSLRLSRVHDGQAIYRVTASDLGLPAGLNIRQMTPDRYELELEPVETREMRVRVNQRGDVPTGHEVLQVSAYPERVEVRGPVRYLDEMDALFTRTLDLSGRSQSFTTELDLVPQRPFVTPLHDGPVQVTVALQATETSRELEGVSVILEGAERSWVTLVDSTIRVRVRGPERTVLTIDPTSTYASVQLTDEELRTPGVYLREPSLAALPRVLRVEEIQPAQVRVRVSTPPEPESPEARPDEPDQPTSPEDTP